MHSEHRPRGRGLVAAALAALAGCSGTGSPLRFETGLNAEQKAAAASIPVYVAAPAEGSYRVKQPVRGMSCRITVTDDYQINREDAVEELQRAALKAGASAITEVVCERLAWPNAPSGCTEAIVCRGVAVGM